MKLTNAQILARKLLCNNATNVMLFGGSRSGKTFIICRRMLANALRVPCRQGILRRNFNTVRSSIGMDTMLKVINLQQMQGFVSLNKSDWIFSVHGCEGEGSEIWLLGLDDKERADKVLGMEFSTLYFNECSEISWGSVETANSRLAQNVPRLKNRAYFDCNPPSKSHWAYRAFIQKVNPESRISWIYPDEWQSMRMNPHDNAENLPEGYIDGTLSSLSIKKRQRFLYGEWSDDAENALWKRDMIDQHRVDRVPDDLERIVVAVDPAVTNTENSDSTGIVVAGRKMIGDVYHFYVLADGTMKGTPEQWSAKVQYFFREYQADNVIVETNNGGDLVILVLRNTNRDMPISTVHARRGKILRAEPISGIYEQGRVHHVGEFLDLEDQMCCYTGAENEESPDNLDAMVYAIMELSEGAGIVSGGDFSFG